MKKQKEKTEYSEYDIQAKDFLKKTDSEIKITFLKYDYHFLDDSEKRDIYEIVLKRGDRNFIFKFGNSINSSGEYIFYGNNGKELIHLEKNKDNKPKMYYKGIALNNGNSKKNKEFKIPTEYDILSCLTYNNPEDFSNFCLEYGYSEDSIKALKIYEAVKNEYNNLKMLYNNSEMDLLREIQ
jgi:hypothetical protein